MVWDLHTRIYDDELKEEYKTFLLRRFGQINGRLAEGLAEAMKLQMYLDSLNKSTHTRSSSLLVPKRKLSRTMEKVRLIVEELSLMRPSEEEAVVAEGLLESKIDEYCGGDPKTYNKYIKKLLELRIIRPIREMPRLGKSFRKKKYYYALNEDEILKFLGKLKEETVWIPRRGGF